GHFEGRRRRQACPDRYVTHDDAFPPTQEKSFFLEGPGHAFHILQRTRVGMADGVQVEFSVSLRIRKMHLDPSIGTPPKGNPYCPVDGHGQYKAVVVIRVLADEIDATGGPHTQIGCPLPLFLEEFDKAL